MIRWMERKGTGQLKVRCYPEHADALFEFLTDKANWTRKKRENEAEKRVKCDPVTSAGEEEEG